MLFIHFRYLQQQQNNFYETVLLYEMPGEFNGTQFTLEWETESIWKHYKETILSAITFYIQSSQAETTQTS